MRADDAEHRTKVRDGHLRAPQFGIASFVVRQLSPRSANFMLLNPLYSQVMIGHMALCVCRNLKLLCDIQAVCITLMKVTLYPVDSPYFQQCHNFLHCHVYPPP
jgi:hypothetical protein